ncbi:universal stress protein [Devosia sp. SD17-2]|uniref:universal stress protein n=1 Tax=Devosia sp. SD17-2 TaxID=2976459 RepID=UPI0023D80012|nr:universal stress protein [Devosia sp. SD17-2]WEJ33180.1 universal stress protein [Devosia sp. SD17-2]
MVVKRAADEPYRRVIAAIDFSPMSFAAAQSAAQIAPSAKLELIHFLEIPLTFEQAMLKVGTSQAELDQYRQAKARTAYVELCSIRADLALAGKTRVVRGDPATALVRLARSGRTDLIALGIQGKSAVSKLILGSAARRVLAASSCDVLLSGGAISRD